MRVTCVQLDYPAGEEVADRRDRVLDLIDEAADADLVVLPELWPTGYFAFDRYAAEAETLDGATVTALRTAAARHRVHLMGGTFVERHGQALTNTAVLIGPDGDVLLTYRKIHLFGYQSEEAQLLAPGRDAPVARTALGGIATSTCYDVRFPELYRAFVDDGAELVIIPAAWPHARLEHWRLLLRARAVENQAVVIACNGTGDDHGTQLGGHSMVIDAWGDVIVEAGEDPQLLTATLDLDRTAAIRAEFPVLEHRRL